MFQKLTKIFIFSYNYFLFDGWGGGGLEIFCKFQSYNYLLFDGGGGGGVRNLLQISIM